jgi:hypothetical protein
VVEIMGEQRLIILLVVVVALEQRDLPLQIRLAMVETAAMELHRLFLARR